MQIAHLPTVLDRAAARRESLDSEIQVEKVCTCLGEGVSLYDEVQFVMGDGHMGPPWEQTTEDITFPQLRWWGVKLLENVSW